MRIACFWFNCIGMRDFPFNERFDQLYAAQQALAWAADPEQRESPLDMINRFTVWHWGRFRRLFLLSVIRPRLDVPYAVPLIGFDAYPILADADDIGVLPIDDIPSTFLAPYVAST